MSFEYAISGDTFQMGLFSDANATWTDLSAAGAESSTGSYIVDLTGYTKAKMGLAVAVAGSTGSKIRLQYSLDNSAWETLTAVGVAIDATGLAFSDWEDLAALGQALVVMRLFAYGGDSDADPALHASLVPTVIFQR